MCDAFGLVALDYNIGELAEDHNTKHHADAGGEERQTNGALVEAVLVGVDEREGADK